MPRAADWHTLRMPVLDAPPGATGAIMQHRELISGGVVRSSAIALSGRTLNAKTSLKAQPTSAGKQNQIRSKDSLAGIVDASAVSPRWIENFARTEPGQYCSSLLHRHSVLLDEIDNLFCERLTDRPITTYRRQHEALAVGCIIRQSLESQRISNAGRLSLFGARHRKRATLDSRVRRAVPVVYGNTHKPTLADAPNGSTTRVCRGVGRSLRGRRAARSLRPELGSRSPSRR